MSELSKQSCVPCRGGTPALNEKEAGVLLKKLGNGWKVNAQGFLEKEYLFPDFRTALTFTNRVGEVAEKEGHHPDLYLSWGKVKLELWTHKARGLTESDFILAAKCDEQLIID